MWFARKAKPDQQPPRFLCDEMLQRLGKWLRSAGYDTEIACDAQTDYYLLRRTIDEQRLLLTRDKELSRHRRAKEHVLLLSSDKLDEQINQLDSRLHINWLFDPFSRCLNCNTLLNDADPSQIHTAPASQQDNALYYCPQCQQIYWDGSHVQRMRRQLARWAAGTEKI